MSDRRNVSELTDAPRSTRSVGNQIEFLPPNDAAFGMADVADFVGFDGADEAMFGDEGPRSKWLPAAATIVVLALLGGGVIAAAPWDDSGSPAPSPTTSVAPATTVATTDRAPTTTEPALTIDQAGPPGYVLDDPGTFQVAGAWAIGAEFRPSEAYADDRFDLWTSPGATRTTGQWLAIATHRSRSDYDETIPNGIRVAVGNGTGVVSTSADGVSRLLFEATDDTPFELSGFGLDLASLLTVAAQVGAGPDDTIDYGTLPDGTLAALTPAVSEHVPNGGLNPFRLLAQPQAGVYYVDPTTHSTIELTANRPTALDVAVLDFLFQPVVDLTSQDQAQLDALTRDGRRFRLSTMPDFPGTIVATATQPGDELMLDTIGSQSGDSITMWGTNVSASAMIRTLSRIRLATDDEWVDLIDRSNRGVLIVDNPSPPSTLIGSNDRPDPGEARYRIEMIPAFPPYIFVSTDRSGWAAPLPEIPSDATVRRFASPTVTYLIATVRQPSPIRQMRVTLEGMPPVDIAMVHVDKSVDAAGYGFTEMLPDTVEFLDENGDVVPV
jgi:hypothetical protein